MGGCNSCDGDGDTNEPEDKMSGRSNSSKPNKNGKAKNKTKPRKKGNEAHEMKLQTSKTNEFLYSDFTEDGSEEELERDFGEDSYDQYSKVYTNDRSKCFLFHFLILDWLSNKFTN